MEKAIIIFGAKYLIFLLQVLAGIFWLTLGKKERKQLLLLGMVALPLSYLIAKLAGLAFFNPRPFAVENFAPLISHISDNGFPSDHSLLASSIAMIVFWFNKKVGSFLLAGALLVGAGRVAAGVHHPLDVLGSFVISISCVCFAYFWLVPKIVNSKFASKINFN